MSTASPFRPAGTVYGVLLNFRGELQALAPQMHEPPYKAPPGAPILYIKPANTWSAHGSAIALPANAPQAEIGATMAMIMGRDAQAVKADHALEYIAGYVLMNDLSIPHTSFYRPPVKYKCPDGFLGVGPQLRQATEAGDPASFALEVHINGALKQSVRFADLVRNAPRLLADVTEFMTLRTGDVLMLGCDAGRPLARAGDRIDINAPGFAALSNTLVAKVAA